MVCRTKQTHASCQQFSDMFIKVLNKHTNVQLSNIKLYQELVRKFMCKLPHKFSRSPDDKPSAVLKCLSYELCTPLYIIFKISLDSGICPSFWKSADITIVYKKGDALQVYSYSPITILPAMCCLFE